MQRRMERKPYIDTLQDDGSVIREIPTSEFWTFTAAEYAAEAAKLTESLSKLVDQQATVSATAAQSAAKATTFVQAKAAQSLTTGQ